MGRGARSEIVKKEWCCYRKIPVGRTGRSRICLRRGTVWRRGKCYCWQHDPVYIKRRKEEDEALRARGLKNHKWDLLREDRFRETLKDALAFLKSRRWAQARNLITKALEID